MTYLGFTGSLGLILAILSVVLNIISMYIQDDTTISVREVIQFFFMISYLLVNASLPYVICKILKSSPSLMKNYHLSIFNVLNVFIIIGSIASEIKTFYTIIQEKQDVGRRITMIFWALMSSMQDLIMIVFISTLTCLVQQTTTESEAIKESTNILQDIQDVRNQYSSIKKCLSAPYLLTFSVSTVYSTFFIFNTLQQMKSDKDYFFSVFLSLYSVLIPVHMANIAQHLYDTYQQTICDFW